MKKIIICFLVSLVTLIFSSCVTNSSNHKQTADEAAEELQNKIMECFVDKDKETLKDFFSEYASSKYNLDYQIEEAFNFIDGEIVSYDDPITGAVGDSDKKNYGARTLNIITDKGTVYKISFNGWLTNSEEPDKIGVLRVKIIDMTVEYDPTKSEVENGILYIGESE